MIFDLLCGIAERHLPPMIPLLRKAHLFHFPGKAHDVLPAGSTEDDAVALLDMFFLPYSTCAIEDTASCIILEDIATDQIGFDQPRRFIECLPVISDIENFNNLTDEQIKYHNLLSKHKNDIPEDSCSVSYGTIRLTEVENMSDGRQLIGYYGTVEDCVIACKEKVLSPPSTNIHDGSPLMKGLIKNCLRNAKAAIEEVCYFNRHDRFVVERTSLNQKKPGPKIPRSVQRPLYTTLTVTEIKQQLIQAQPTEIASGRTQTPHSRRRHFRKLSSDRYKTMKGKTIVVPATWVGPSEITKGRHHYKICLDV
jgi:hypothetical protein